MGADIENLVKLVAPVTAAVAGRPLDRALGDLLDERFPGDGPAFGDIAAACMAGIAAGWLCEREQGGIRFGRAVRPGPATHGFSVDVVRYADLAGPHHAHPTGEIDMIVPVTPTARFDGKGRGWLVYPPGSAHRPTISDGEAVVLYLLPDGRLDFTKP